MAEGEGPGSLNRLQGRRQDLLAKEGPRRAAGLVPRVGEHWLLPRGHQRLYTEKLPKMGGDTKVRGCPSGPGHSLLGEAQSWLEAEQAVCSLHRRRGERGGLHRTSVSGQPAEVPVCVRPRWRQQPEVLGVGEADLGPLRGSVSKHPPAPTVPFAFSPLRPLLLLAVEGFLGLGSCLGPLSSATQCAKLGFVPVPAQQQQQGAWPPPWPLHLLRVVPRGGSGSAGSCTLAVAGWEHQAGLGSCSCQGWSQQSCEDDLQDVTEKCRVTRGSCSGNPVSVLQDKWGNRAGSSAEPDCP